MITTTLNTLETLHEIEKELKELLKGKTATKVYKEGNQLRVRYHNTDLFVFNPDGYVKMSNGGYETATTNQRINAVLYKLFEKGFINCERRVFQKNGEWFIKSSNLYFEGRFTDKDFFFLTFQ
jgi:hypothetical protein